jgi:transcriptional regulator with XRE-family HTH domain
VYHGNRKEDDRVEFTIRQARTHAGLTQQELAKRLGIDRSTYHKIEKDASRATVAQVLTISQETGIPVADIILAANSTKVDSLNQ